MGDINPGRSEPFPPTPYKFSPDELRVLKRCNKESFYQRSLPLSTFLGLGTYWCVKAGYLKSSPRWGATGKVIGAVAVGYFLGKLSYQQKCAEMILQLPNSELAEALRRKRRDRSSQETISLDPSFGGGALSPFSSLPSTDTYSDLDSHAYSDIDDRPYHDSLDDSYHPNMDFPALEDDSALPPKGGPPVTYDDLRRKNRGDFVSKSNRSYRGTPGLSEAMPIPEAKPDPNFQPPSRIWD